MDVQTERRVPCEGSPVLALSAFVSADAAVFQREFHSQCHYTFKGRVPRRQQFNNWHCHGGVLVNDHVPAALGRPGHPSAGTGQSSARYSGN
ncbi:hypothetical protein D3C80_1878730 [compost metagenome]